MNISWKYDGNKTKVIRADLLFVPIWTHLEPLGLIWTNLEDCGPIWTHLDPFEPI